MYPDLAVLEEPDIFYRFSEYFHESYLLHPTLLKLHL